MQRYTGWKGKCYVYCRAFVTAACSHKRLPAVQAPDSERCLHANNWSNRSCSVHHSPIRPIPRIDTDGFAVVPASEGETDEAMTADRHRRAVHLVDGVMREVDAVFA